MIREHLEARLQETRRAIEEVDRHLLIGLNRRAALVRDIQDVKATLGKPVMDPARETYLNRLLVSQNAGPLSNEQVEILFDQIRDATMPEAP